MDPSYYSPQLTSASRVHAAVCYCRVHGNSAQAQMSPRSYHQHFHYDPPSPRTRQLIQKHPEALVIHTAGQSTQIGESYESFDRKRALVKYQSQSKVIKVMFY